MSSEATLATGLTRCMFCSIGCRAGLQPLGLDQYAPAYPDADSGEYAGLCARGSMFAELANHRERLLWGLVADDGRLREVTVFEAMREAAERFRVATVNAHPYVVIDGNADLATLDFAVSGFERHLPSSAIALDLPQADVELVAGCDTSDAHYIALSDLAAADAILVVGNPFASHPVSAHWILDLGRAARRRPLLVLDVHAGVTGAYATGTAIVLPGTEHVALGQIAQALKVPGIATGGSAMDGEQASNWAHVLSGAKRPAVVVTSEFGRAARWYEVGLVAGRIATVAGGGLAMLTAYGGARGAARLSAARHLANGDTLRHESRESQPNLAILLGPGTSERFADLAGRRIVASPLRPDSQACGGVTLPMAWPFEIGGQTLSSDDKSVTWPPAAPPPAAVPSLVEIVRGIAGEPPHAHSQAGSWPRIHRQAAPDMSPLAPAGGNEGLILVLVADPVNFADGAVTRRVSFPSRSLPCPTVWLSPADVRRAGFAEGQSCRVSAAGKSVVATVGIEEEQRSGQAVMSAAYAECQKLVSAACEGKRLAPVRVAASVV